MDVVWIWVIVATIIYVILYLSITSYFSKRELKRQITLYKTLAEKHRVQFNDDSPRLALSLPNNAFRLLIFTDVKAEQRRYKIIVSLGWNRRDLSEQVSHFPKVAVFPRRKPLNEPPGYGDIEFDKSRVRQNLKKVRLGEKDFDKAFSIYAENETDVDHILTPEIRQRLLALKSKFPRLITNDMMRFLALSKFIRDTDTFDLFITLAMGIAQNLTGTGYVQKQATEYVADGGNVASDNLAPVPLEYKKENTMSFFKNLFGKSDKGEPFVPTPSQNVPGLAPIVVQAIENLYPDADDQKKAFKYSLEYAEKNKRDVTISLLTMLAYSQGNIDQLPSSTLWHEPRFNGEELSPIFHWKMKNAEEWVKSITKPRV